MFQGGGRAPILCPSADAHVHAPKRISNKVSLKCVSRSRRTLQSDGDGNLVINIPFYMMGACRGREVARVVTLENKIKMPRFIGFVK